MKKEYVAPELEDLGSVEELTLAGARGKRLDNDYGSGTPFDDLTFS
jgi:hypothetical protein